MDLTRDPGPFLFAHRLEMARQGAQLLAGTAELPFGLFAPSDIDKRGQCNSTAINFDHLAGKSSNDHGAILGPKLEFRFFYLAKSTCHFKQPRMDRRIYQQLQIKYRPPDCLLVGKAEQSCEFPVHIQDSTPFLRDCYSHGCRSQCEKT